MESANIKNQVTGIEDELTLNLHTSKSYNISFYNNNTLECAEKGAFINLYCQNIEWINTPEGSFYIIDISQDLTKVEIGSAKELSFNLQVNPDIVI